MKKRLNEGLFCLRKTVFLLLFFVSTLIGAQNVIGQINVKGKVTDAQGQALPGATIQVSGTSVGTISGIDGSYSIQVQNGNAVLQYSFIGFTTQKNTVGKQTVINISLIEDSQNIDDVVVVGYGTQKKSTLTGAVSAVSGDNLVKRTMPSLSTALQGLMPGVTVQQTSGEPGADGANIRIRGIGSINSSTFPLVLVDGIEMDMNQVDMNTVESVSVLKDGASAAIYGSRASNGVILITTKRGKEGKVKVNYNSSYTIQMPTNMPEVVKAADYLAAELQAWDNAGITVSPDTRTAREKLIQDQRTLKPDNWNRYDTDWKSATVAKSSPMQNHNLTLSGGGKDVRYFASVSYLNQDGLIKNNSFDRVNVRTNTDANIFSWMKLSNEIVYRQSTQITPAISSPKSIINKSLYMLPTLSAVKELDGNWGFGKNGDNPVANAEASGTSSITRPELLLNSTLTITPLKNLEILGQYSIRKTEARSTLITMPYVTSLKGIVQGKYPAQDGVNESYSQNLRNFYRTQAAYSLSSVKHNVKIMAGFQAEDNTSTSFGASKRGFQMNRYYLDNGDGATASASGGASAWSMASAYGRFNYDYDGKYLVEMTGRYDGSSRFSDKLKWGFFPSVSTGWVISRENFMQSTRNFLDLLKLRASYGTLGNQDIGDYPYASRIETGYSYWFDKQLSSGVAQTALSNPAITWEKSTQINVGFDANFFSGKITSTFDYYIKDVSDMLMVFPVPYYTGLNATYSNAGDMRNKGWEFTATYKSKVGELNYSVTGVLSNNENTVTDLKGNAFTDNSIREGYPRGSYWGYLTDGYFTNWDDVNNSAKLSKSARPGYVKYKKIDQTTGVDPLLITNKDQVYLGDPFPHYEYGLNLSANFKGFDVSVFVQGVAKRNVMMSGIGLKPFTNGANLFVHQLDSWTPDHLNAEYPILVPEANSADNFVTSDKWVRSGAYMRIKNVVIGYNLPKTWTSRMKLDNARIYASGQNLYTLSNFFKGYDPEVNYGGSLGGEFYPIMQTITFGIDIKF
jgi:TonB-linked SusC/RagA family outer membrane protein